MKNIFFLIIGLIWGSGCSLLAQTISPFSLNSAGGNDIRLTFALGDLAVADYNALRQGFIDLTIIGNAPVSAQIAFETPQTSEKQEFTLHFFPNPVESTLTIQTNYEGLKQVQIIDMKGVQVWQGRLENEQVQLQALKPSMYVVRLFGANEELIKTFKIIKQ
jgi:hypothetical protein